VADVLRHPRIMIRGHVPDLDAEVLSSQIFLTVNNSGPFRGGHTRIQYAWSLGSCVVAHRNYQECIPELEHMDNVLMGESADEIADLVAQAASDQRLRSRIAEAGRATYERSFTPEVVVPKLLAELELAVHAPRAGQTVTGAHASRG
jgi:glycosyltransferase involved in cell wall biosynthesis